MLISLAGVLMCVDEYWLVESYSTWADVFYSPFKILEYTFECVFIWNLYLARVIRWIHLNRQDTDSNIWRVYFNSSTARKPKHMRKVRSSSLLGIFWMLGAMVFLVLTNAVTKWLSKSYPAEQIIFSRSFFVIITLLIVVTYDGGWVTLKINNFRYQFLRALFHTITAILIVFSVTFLPLADVETLLFASILFIVLLSASCSIFNFRCCSSIVLIHNRHNSHCK